MTDKITGKFSPEEAIPKALDCASFGLEFVENGHLYTTYKVAILAGLDVQNALVLAYFSQYPDIDSEFNAVNQIENTLLDPEHRSLIMSKLHSLHGGNSAQIYTRKNQLGSSIKDLLASEQYWKAGILIHSLGDAYAHTTGKLGDKDEKAYGPIFGHAKDSLLDLLPGIRRDPDDIDRKIVREKYVAYVLDLFDLLRTPDANHSELNKFVSNISIENCISKVCPTFQVLAGSDKDVLDRFIKCMNERMRSLAVSEVKSLFEKI